MPQVGSADVYDDLYHLAEDVSSDNLADAGVRLGMLLSVLRTSDCTTEACNVLEGLLRVAKLAATDYTACAATLDAAWSDLSSSIHSFEDGHWATGGDSLGAGLSAMATSVQACGLSQLGPILSTTATSLHAIQAATYIGDVVHILTEGSDLTLDLQQLISSAQSGDWQSFGASLGSLGAWLSGTGCTSYTCSVLEGLLDGLAIPFQSLKACEADVQASAKDFLAGASALGHQPADLESSIK